MKYISIIGSTGSIGTQTLDIVRSNKDLKVTALAAGTSIDLLEKQAREFQPVIVAVYNEQKAEELKLRLADTNIKVCAGMDGLLEAATQEQCSVVVTAIVGMIGIRPTIVAMKAGKDIALANKETLELQGISLCQWRKNWVCLFIQWIVSILRSFSAYRAGKEMILIL